MERKLASIQKVLELRPIEGADMIEVATINAWQLVVKKGEFKVDDLCVYCEIDCLMPDKPEFEFLKPRNMRIKTIKLRGQISQGICFPVSILPSGIEIVEDADVTDVLGIVKYEPAIHACLSGIAKGNFPSFIPKTDEERIQNLSRYFERFKDNLFYITEKLDGSSATFYFKDGVFGVCSRNLDLIETEGNSFWKVARELDIENKLSNLGNYAIQGELIGEGIQGNPYKIKGQKVLFFNAWDIDASEHVDMERFKSLMHEIGLDTVPVLDTEFKLPNTISDLLILADGKSYLHKEVDREGLVIRSIDRKISFKVISNKFLLKEK